VVRFTKAGAGVGLCCSSKLRAGWDPVPCPTANRTALWVWREPQWNFYPRLRKEWDNIASNLASVRSRVKWPQVHR